MINKGTTQTDCIRFKQWGHDHNHIAEVYNVSKRMTQYIAVVVIMLVQLRCFLETWSLQVAVKQS